MVFEKMILRNVKGLLRQVTRRQLSVTPKVENFSCCPPGSWGRSSGNEEYIDQGKVVDLNGLEAYIVGEPNEKGIIWSNDVFGFDSGNTRKMCDFMAKNGYFVVLPNFFRDDWVDPAFPYETVKAFMQKHSIWDNIKVDIEDHVLPFVAENGITKLGSVGTCWGSYVVMRCSARPEFMVGASMHPTHTAICNRFLDPAESEAQLLLDVKCPQLIMPASNDSDNAKPGGLADYILGDLGKIVKFDEMIHGWTTRGDSDDPIVARDQERCLNLIVEFFELHMADKEAMANKCCHK